MPIVDVSYAAEKETGMSDVPIPQARQERPAFRRLAPQGAGALPGFAKADAEAAAGRRLALALIELVS